VFLTPEELAILTGRKYAKYQIAWLTACDWAFEIDANGAPKVLRSYAEHRMGTRPPTKRRGPRLDGLAMV
jgi:hypothetical protein